MKILTGAVSLLVFVLLSACSAGLPDQAKLSAPTLNPPSVTTSSGGDIPTSIPTALPPTAAPDLAASAPTASPTPEAPAASATPLPVESSAVKSPTQMPTSQPDKSASCMNKMAFFADVTVPDGTLFKQGETFTKTWRLRNEGTCTIDQNYSLVFASGDPLSGPLTAPMPGITPGQVVDLSLNLSAPSQGGTYAANYEFQDPQGNRFGVNSSGVDYIWVEIKVDWISGKETVAAATTSSPAPITGDCSYGENPAYLDQILSLVNNARVADGESPLSPNPLLMAAAKVHSIDMGCHNFLDHTGSDGSKARDRMIAQGYKPTYAAENIYAGATQYGADAQGAFDWWMNSPVHRKNILNARPTEVGIGYVNVPGSDFGGYYTMVFAKP